MNFSSDPINTIENLIARNSSKGISLYLVLLGTVITFLFLFPVIKVEVSSQSRGIVRSYTDKVPLQVLVNGKITQLKLRNKGKTIIIIAHRLSTIANADLILVMENGGIAEQGNHTTLLNLKGKYFELWNKQSLV